MIPGTCQEGGKGPTGGCKSGWNDVNILVRSISKPFSFWRAELNCGAILANVAGEGVAKKEVKLFSDVFQKRADRVR